MGILGKIKNGIVSTGKSISAELERQAEVRRQKTQILNQLDMNGLKKVCKNYGIGEPLNYDPMEYQLTGQKTKFTLTRDHYINYIINNMTLAEIRSMGEKLRLNVPDLPEKVEEVEPIRMAQPTEEVEAIETSEEPETVEAKPKPVNKDEEELKRIIQLIKRFEPKKVFSKEAEYENTLYSWLNAFYPKIDFQYPCANSRIDMKISKFGIEIKNHPDQNEVNRLIGQLRSYRPFFKHIIVVIFNGRDLKAIKFLKEQIKEMDLAVTVIEK
jgi:rubrerythrin